jgi:hypothetical protein
MTIKQIASDAADEIMELKRQDCLDKSIVELLITSALAQAERDAFDSYHASLRGALKSRYLVCG